MTKLLASLILLALALVPLPATAGAGWIAVPGSSGGGGTWGSITGTLSDQTDLQTALDAKVAGIGTPTVDGFGIRELPIYSDDTGKVITTQSGYGLYPTDKLLELGTLWFHGVQGTLGTNTTGSHFQFQGSGTWVQQVMFPYPSIVNFGVLTGNTHYPFGNASVQKLHLGYDQADALASVSAGTIKAKSVLNLSTTDEGIVMNTTGSKPTCNSTRRSQLFITQGGAGVADVVEICLKDAADAYAWVTK